jgi:hypothetical protein
MALFKDAVEAFVASRNEIRRVSPASFAPANSPLSPGPSLVAETCSSSILRSACSMSRFPSFP